MFQVDPKTTYRTRTSYSGVVSLKAVNTLLSTVKADLVKGEYLHVISEWIDTVSEVVQNAEKDQFISESECTRLLRDVILPARDLVFYARNPEARGD